MFGLLNYPLEKASLRAYQCLPARFKDMLTAWGLGDLTADDPGLRRAEVPDITITEILAAMQRRRSLRFPISDLLDSLLRGK